MHNDIFIGCRGYRLVIPFVIPSLSRNLLPLYIVQKETGDPSTPTPGTFSLRITET